MNIFQFLYESNKEHLKDTAIRYFQRNITYGQLFSDIDSCCRSLAALGIGSGSVVTIQSLNMPQIPVLLYACSRLGAVANLVYVTENEQSLHDILLRTETKLYVVMDAFYEKMQAALCGTAVANILLLSVKDETDAITGLIISLKNKKPFPEKCFSWHEFLKLEKEPVYEIVSPDAPVVMIYTSGTTGKSKAVVLSLRNMNAIAIQYEVAGLGLERGKKYLNTLPPFIAFGTVFALHAPLCIGITDILVVDPTPSKASVYFRKYKPNYFVNGIQAIESIIGDRKLAKMDLSFIDVLSAGGEAIPLSLETNTNKFLAAHNSNKKLVIGYGMTEMSTTVVTTALLPGIPGVSGIPLPLTTVKIVAFDTTDEVGYGTEGEVCFRSPTMMLGYYADEESTRTIIKQHPDGYKWIHSGDIGKIDANGIVTVTGRIKRVIECRLDGIYHKIFPQFIEQEFGKHIDSCDFAIVGRKNTDNINELVAFVTCPERENWENIKTQLADYSNMYLQPWERPAEYIKLNAYPRTEIGKINYRQLEKMANQ